MNSGARARAIISIAGLLGAAGCRSAAPERFSLGATSYGARQYLGSLPFWEGPADSASGPPLQGAAHAFAIDSDREMESFIAEIWRENGRVSYQAEVLSGAISARAADGRGRVVYFRRHVTPSGDRYDLDADRLYLVDLRRRAAAEALETPAFNKLRGGTATVVCAVGGRLLAWLETPAGFAARPVSGAPMTASATQADAPSAWPPWMCVSDDACASILFEQGPAPPVVEIRCGDRVERETLEDHWPSSTVLHPRGTVASFSTGGWKSSVQIRLPGATARSFPFDGTVYALTFWDQRTLLVHVATGGPNAPTHISVVSVDAERGPVATIDLDFARAASDRKSMPAIALLPSSGNGRPLLARVDDDLVLITGTGEIWTWRTGR